MTPDLERIEALAKAATAGPWTFIAGDAYCAYPSVHIGGKHFLIEDHYDSDCNKERHESGGYPGKDEDAEFIAAANPETVLSLINAMRQERTYCDSVEAENKRMMDVNDRLEIERNVLVARVRKLEFEKTRADINAQCWEEIHDRSHRIVVTAQAVSLRRGNE